MMESMPMDPQTLRTFLQGSNLTWQLSIDEFIEGDPQAVFDNTNKVVTWKLPIYDVLFGEEPVQVFTISRLETAETTEPEPEKTDEPERQEVTTPTAQVPTPEIVIQPPAEITPDQPDQGFLGLPNQVPFVVAAVLCLGGMFVVIAAVVIILVVRKQKQNQTENQNEQDSN